MRKLSLTGLERYLASGEAVDPAVGAAWVGSPNGKDFMTASGEYWRVAHALPSIVADARL
jgi:hypothetical protein